MKTRADLTALPGFDGLAVDTSGNPCVWRNFYSCQCPDGPQCDWEMEWSCQCDDECPACGADCAPYDSIWLGPRPDVDLACWASLPEAGSLGGGARFWADIGARNLALVREWFGQHLCGTQSECAAALGLSLVTVHRHVKTIRAGWRRADPSTAAGRRLSAGADDAAASPPTNPGSLP